jgi:hypothetical protein
VVLEAATGTVHNVRQLLLVTSVDVPSVVRHGDDRRFGDPALLEVSRVRSDEQAPQAGVAGVDGRTGVVVTVPERQANCCSDQGHEQRAVCNRKAAYVSAAERSWRHW